MRGASLEVVKALRTGLTYYAAAALLLAGMFAGMAALVILLRCGESVPVAAGSAVIAVILGLGATRLLAKAMRAFRLALTPGVVSAGRPSSRETFIASMVFFFVTWFSAYALAMALLFGVAAIRPVADRGAVSELLIAASGAYSVIMASMFYGGVRGPSLLSEEDGGAES